MVEEVDEEGGVDGESEVVELLELEGGAAVKLKGLEGEADVELDD